MKQFILSILSICFLVITGMCVVGGWAIHHYLSPSKNTEEKLVLIKQGKGISPIAHILEDNQIITQPVIFKIAASLGDSLKAGEYLFPARASMAEVISIMQEGKVFDRKITLIEG